MTKLFSYFAGITLVFLAASCETDVDLRAPYDDTPIVFGVLDQTVDTQFIKINRAFIGEGDNFKYAAIADCTIFQNVKASVTEVGGSNRVFPLKELYVKNIDEGIFYEDSQKVYYFNTISETGALDENASYELEISIDEGRKEVTSNTGLVGDFPVDKTELKEEIDFIKLEPNSQTLVFNDLKPVLWEAGSRDLLFSVILRFHYVEHLISGEISPQYIDVPMGTIASDFPGEDLTILFNGQTFFNNVKADNHLNELDINQVDKRVVGNIEFVMSVANSTLKTYIDLNEPSNGIVQDKPSFTNIIGGRGVFSSKYSKTISKSRFGSDMILNKYSIEELSNLGYGFCSDNFKYSSGGADPQGFYCQ